MEFIEKLKKYAETVIKIGANVQKDQLVVIRALTENREFVYLLSEEAYKVGASDVQVIWRDDVLARQKYKYASKETLEEVKSYIVDQYDDCVKNNAVFISIVGSDPNNLEGLDQEKIKAGTMAVSKSMTGLRKALMSDENSWVVIGAATKAWSKIVFPELNAEEAVSKLWETIFYTMRIDGDAVGNWEKHIENLSSKAKYLNDMKFKYLKYTSEKGTNLTIELPKGHIWTSGKSLNSKCVEFTANMPTEEVFTLPHKDGVNGVVYSTKPLNYSGNLIDEFKLVFEKGKVVDYSAKKGESVLKSLLETDEGALSLGEVALVPFDSPISNTNIMFSETLFDENASCHLALGRAYPTCIEGGTTMNEEESLRAGVNNSLVHEDFMIGDASLNIVGITEYGKEIPVFINGNWA
ncbi:aminopeptidase [Streptobacillus felis]|uniref:Aminopeptidase n=2 Tax=Streptobacillus TaxID=34104 RepID=A0A7Z0PFP0_9FUSO|nr:aminopeptidase [Streptobacillus felis]NYV27220.1 aminopeptidase [Streptobacillus felis]